MTQHILTCNAGSNSLKCALFEVEPLSLAYRFEADHIHDNTTISIRDAEGCALAEDKSISSGYSAALEAFLEWCEQKKEGMELTAAGHRVVHGGREFKGPAEVTSETKHKLRELIPLAPTHQPHNLELIDILSDTFPDLRQAVSFDTAFHRTQPWLAQQFALPRKLTEENAIFRYGFHGLSYEYIRSILPEHIGELEGQRVIIAHLGSGASMCALRDGKSIATTMGFTALDGLMMSTRPGDLDPGILLYLLQQKNMSVNELEQLLYKESGLLGVSGISKDMRDLDDKDNQEARQAVALFCYMAARQLGGLVAVMGGMDALVFTGAMGSGDFLIRAMICDYLTWLQLEIDEVANVKYRSFISTEVSPVKVLALPTDEEQVIAEQTVRILNLTPKEVSYGKRKKGENTHTASLF